MNHTATFKLAASTLVLGLTMVGCTPATNNYGLVSASAKAPRAEQQAAALYQQAQAAVQQSQLAQALTLTEQAVELSPTDTGYRMLLGDLYLKNGRFVSAEQAFTDVLTLDPNNSRATLSVALAQIAQGENGPALTALNRLAQTAAPGDVGLAFALAGQPGRAIEMLEPAARATDADGRVRQNLALAYALAGDWQKSRATAAQDVSPAEINQRMEHWASLANPSAGSNRIALLFGVTPVSDAGQPERLALAPAAAQSNAYASVDIALPSVEASEQAAAPAGAPVEVASATATDAYTYEAPAQPDLFAQPTAIAAVDLPSSVAMPAVERGETAEVRYAAAVEALVEAPAPAEKPAVVAGKAPLPTFQPARKKQQLAAHRPSRFVVQIGAYKNSRQVEQAWTHVQRRYDLGGSQPLSTTVSIPGRGIFHRLSVSGFGTTGEAGRVCRSIRARGGACFVRTTAGDAPIQWASRTTRRG